MAKKRILIVDDEVSFGIMLKLNLEQAGKYEVMVENKGTQALARALIYRPHLILLDIIMPDIDGGEVATQISADEKLKNTPIVFLTAAVKKEEAGHRKGLIGGRPFIAKPAKAEEIIRTIDKYIK